MKIRNVVLFLCVISLLMIGCVPAIAGEGASAGTAVPGGTVTTPGTPTVNVIKSVDKASALPGETLNYTVVISDAGMEATGVTFSDTLDTNLTLVPGSLQASPVAANDYYNCTGNLSISVPAEAGVLVNDYVGLNPAGTISAYDPVSANGAAVSVAADGSFTYEPAAGYNGTDSFTYTLLNTTGSSVGTVYVTVSNRIWFINSAAGACSSSCDGRLSYPFTSLSAFISANVDAAGDRIFIYSGTYAGNLTLKTSQRLIGQGDALNATTLGFTPATYSPSLPGAVTKPTLSGSLTLANNVSVLAVDWVTTSMLTISGIGVSGVTIADQCTVTANGGLALYLNNASGNFTFRSISCDGNQGGIIWNNAVQATGSLTVTGDGSTAGSGGMIHDVMGVDGDSSGYGCGVYLKNAGNVSLSWMNLVNFQNYAVRGLSVNNFTMANCSITGTSGNNAAYYEGCISFGANTGEPGGPANGLTGSATISNCTIIGGFVDNIRIANQSGTLNRLTLSSDIINTAGNHGIFVQGESSAVVNVTATGSTFSGAYGDHFRFVMNGTNIADLIFQNNILTNPAPFGTTGGGGVTLISGNNAGGANTTFNISGNTMQGARADAIHVEKRHDPGTLSGSVANNTIGVQAIANSGSAVASGIWVQNAGMGIMTGNINNNRIYQYNRDGITLQAGGTIASGGSLNVTATQNLIYNAGTNSSAINGLYMNSGATTGDSFTTCVHLQQNSLDTTSYTSGCYGIRLAQRMFTTVVLPGYTGASNDNVAVQDYVFAWQLGYFTLNASNTVGAGGSGFVNGAVCALPSTFTEALPEGNDTHHIVSEELAESEAIELLPAVLSRLSSLGFDVTGIDGFDEESIVIEDLPAGILAEVREERIILDKDASDRGWFVDPSPYDDEEYERSISGEELKAVYGSPAENGVDLLSVIASCTASISRQEDDFKTFGPCVPVPGVRCLPAVNAMDESQETEEEAAAQQDRTEPAILPSIHVESGETVSVSVGTLPAGKSVTLKFAGVIENPLVVPADAVTNQANVSGSNFTALNSNTVTTTLPTPGIHLVKTTNGADNNAVTGPMVPVGSTVTWTYTVTNTGNVPLKNVTVADDHPGVTPVYQSGDTNGNGLLDVTETWVYTATGIAVAGQYTNLGTASGLDSTNMILTPATSTDPDHYFGVNPGIKMVKMTNGTDNNAPTGPLVPVGSTVTWTYTVTNTGNVPLKNVTVADDHSGVTPVYQGGDTNGNGLLDVTETWGYTATGIAVAGQYTNLGMASGMDSTNTVLSPVTSTDPDNYFGVVEQADLSVSKTDSPDPVLAGQNITYTITLTNNGPNDSQSVEVLDYFPPGLTFVSQVQESGPAFTLANTATSVTETISNFPVGATAVFTVVVYVPADAVDGTYYSNAVNVSASTTDPNMGNNSASAGTAVTREADLSVIVADTPDPVIVGENITYTVTVTNNGPGIASGIQVVDTLPPGVTFVSASGTNWTCANVAGSVTCNYSATLASGISAPPITIVVTADTPGIKTGSAVVSGLPADPNPANNSAAASTTVNCQVVTVTVPSVSQGIQNVFFSQTFTQSGGIGTVTFSTTSALPAGLTLAADGILSGTPTAFGSFPMTVTAKDSNNCEGSGLYTLTIFQLPSAPVITAVTDDSPCTQGVLTITFIAGSPATRHDLYRDGSLVLSGVSSPIGYNPGDTASHSYVVRAVNTDDACFADSAAVNAADVNGTPTQPVITGIIDVSEFSTGLVINYTPGSPATRHDLYRDGFLVVTGFVSGGTYVGWNSSQSHSYSILAVNGSCSIMSDAVPAVDKYLRLYPRPRWPLEPKPFPQ